MDKNNITFVIFTFNEEARIENVIKNFKNFGKILIADNKSTDRTIEIANQYGCDVYIRQKHYNYVENQELVDLLYKEISTDWIYWGFADEMLELDALKKISEIISENKYDIINVDRKNYYYGDFCYDVYTSRTNKIFKKGALDFTENQIHGHGKATVPYEKIHILDDKYFVHHFISNNASSYLNVLNRYSDSEEILPNAKYSYTFFYSILFFAKHLVLNFFCKKGKKTGYSAIALIQLMIFYNIFKIMKIYEKHKGLNPRTIEDKNNFARKSIIESIENYG